MAGEWSGDSSAVDSFRTLVQRILLGFGAVFQILLLALVAYAVASESADSDEGSNTSIFASSPKELAIRWVAATAVEVVAGVAVYLADKYYSYHVFCFVLAALVPVKMHVLFGSILWPILVLFTFIPPTVAVITAKPRAGLTCVIFWAVCQPVYLSLMAVFGDIDPPEGFFPVGPIAVFLVFSVFSLVLVFECMLKIHREVTSSFWLRRYAALIAGYSDGVVVLYGDRVAYCNPAFERMFECTLDTVETLPLATFLTVNSETGPVDSVNSALALSLSGGDSIPVPLTAIPLSSAASPFPVEVTVAADNLGLSASPPPVLLCPWSWSCCGSAGSSSADYSDESETLVVTIKSTARMKEAEAKYKQAMRAELEARERLVSEQREQNELKTRFICTVSHELRTPLSGVIGMSEILADLQLNTEQMECVRIIQESSNTLLDLINDLLDIHKISSENITLDEEEFSVRSVVDGTVQMLADRAFNKGLEFSYWVDTEVPLLLRGDAMRLKQVLTNLAGNAVKFTQRGHVVIEVRVDYHVDGVYRLVATIEDTGIGISEEGMSKLFKPFSQVSNSITREFGGTGLGLAITVQLAELMDGNIRVESTVGKGSTFIFTFSLGEVSEPRMRGMLTPASIDFPLLPTTSGSENTLLSWHPTVLVVYKHRRVRHLIRKALESWGCVVRTASDPRQVSTEDENTCQVLILDDAFDQRGADFAVGLKARSAEPVATIVALLPTVKRKDQFTAFLERAAEKVSTWRDSGSSRTKPFGAALGVLGTEGSGSGKFNTRRLASEAGDDDDDGVEPALRDTRSSEGSALEKSAPSGSEGGPSRRTTPRLRFDLNINTALMVNPPKAKLVSEHPASAALTLSDTLESVESRSEKSSGSRRKGLRKSGSSTLAPSGGSRGGGPSPKSPLLPQEAGTGAPVQPPDSVLSFLARHQQKKSSKSASHSSLHNTSSHGGSERRPRAVKLNSARAPHTTTSATPPQFLSFRTPPMGIRGFPSPGLRGGERVRGHRRSRSESLSEERLAVTYAGSPGGGNSLRLSNSSDAGLSDTGSTPRSAGARRAKRHSIGGASGGTYVSGTSGVRLGDHLNVATGTPSQRISLSSLDSEDGGTALGSIAEVDTSRSPAAPAIPAGVAESAALSASNGGGSAGAGESPASDVVLARSLDRRRPFGSPSPLVVRPPLHGRDRDRDRDDDTASVASSITSMGVFATTPLPLRRQTSLGQFPRPGSAASTGQRDGGIDQAAAEAQPDMFIRKPIAWHLLYTLLKEVAGRQLAPNLGARQRKSARRASVASSAGGKSSVTVDDEAARRASLKILVVDDSRLNCKVTTKLLGSLGYTNVQDAPSGEVALVMDSRDMFDAVFLDINMPGMSGFETARSLLASRVSSKPLHIIMYSGSDRDEDKKQAEELGAQYLMKPVTKAQFAEALFGVVGDGYSVSDTTPTMPVEPLSARTNASGVDVWRTRRSSLPAGRTAKSTSSLNRTGKNSARGRPAHILPHDDSTESLSVTTPNGIVIPPIEFPASILPIEQPRKASSDTLRHHAPGVTAIEFDSSLAFTKSASTGGLQATVTSNKSGSSTRRFLEDVSSLTDSDLESASDEPPSPAAFFVLIVDDHPVNVRIMSAHLRSLGVATLTAKNGAEAVEVWESHSKITGLILMDIEMPVMDGITATRRIREIEDRQITLGNLRSRVPIVMLTAYSEQEVVDSARRAGCSDYLVKPVPRAVIVETLQKFRPQRYGGVAPPAEAGMEGSESSSSSAQALQTSIVSSDVADSELDESVLWAHRSPAGRKGSMSSAAGGGGNGNSGRTDKGASAGSDASDGGGGSSSGVGATNGRRPAGFMLEAVSEASLSS